MQTRTTNNNMQIFIFSLIFLFTVIAWIAVEIYHIEKNKKFSVEYQTGMNMTVEVIPNLDLLKKLKAKQWVTIFFIKKKGFQHG